MPAESIARVATKRPVILARPLGAVEQIIDELKQKQRHHKAKNAAVHRDG